MKAHLLWLFTVINLILLVGSASAHDSAVSASAPLAAPVGTAFTYQGRLRSSNNPFNGSCDFQFSLWDALSGGARIGGVLSTNNTLVSDGRFTVQLDFGAAFDGNGRWLQVAVRCPTGSGGFTTLAPRQALAPSPYSVRATSAGSVPWSGITGKPAGFADDVDNTGITVPLNLSGSSANPILSAANSGTGPTGQFNNAGGGNVAALQAISSGSDGTAIYGEANNGSAPYGVWGLTLGGTGSTPQGIGVSGWQGDKNDPNRFISAVPAGVVGSAIANNGIGVHGLSTNYVGVEGYSKNNVGVFGQTDNPNSFAGQFVGRVFVNGTLSKAAGSFKIDHPLDPTNKYLEHSFVESPDMKNIYDGVVTLDSKGAATVTLPAWFEVLNQDFRYQLTAIGAPGPNLYVAQEIQGNRFAIAGGTPGMKVSWQVTGIRHDPYAEQNRIQVEEDKPAEERGTYLYPQGYGQPASKGENYARQQTMSSQSQAQSHTKAP